mmetsp:Transcript_16108/g.32071  ORF Transcript_16108/g.32071 Transcript_16108/m.32071 type:complete len:646 (+) Transcript_16108:16-1953(+)|eukprot:CAMPEP_0197546412 /NCGR_PEP_ID=MMETSP1320-20131121/1013_1 /TAXON_ID=91990 /ORGANISM="Bolidomonas sp., Strain RCC2347" /LENGTH=645 /DNA_ID=CAMNT_0043105967 /DNA_START=16 /DNA_END=1953 /DNA_ORIENTATION=+
MESNQYTATVYGFIKDGNYIEAVRILQYELQNFPRSRAALSLLGYCYYHMSDFQRAMQTYEQLVKICPDVEEYKIYYSQSLFKAGMYPEATRSAVKVNSPQHTQRITMLQASIKYELDELSACKSLLDGCLPDDPETIIAYAAIAYKEGHYEEALEKYSDALNTLGYQADIAYNIALCHYKLEQTQQAMKKIQEIIERGVREHPELSVGSNTDGIDVRSVGNSQVLQETQLVEAFNLKAAIEYNMKDMDNAKEALSDMPPRQEEELDPVTLHNLALMTMDSDATQGFRKLNFLLSNPPFPPETFGNLLLLYTKFGYYDLAADILADNAHLTFKFLTQELYEYLEATIMVTTSPEEAYRKYDELTEKHIVQLRKLTKSINDSKIARATEDIKSGLAEFDKAVEAYMPVLMAQARVYWDRENYPMVESLFRQSAEFCVEHDTWRLNVAHVFFMQETKFKDAIRYYDPIVKKAENILDVTAIVLANLCVAYIMTSQNEEAEELMRKIEKEEDRMAYNDPDKQFFHLCIVNLVIGTLYCAKGNFEFGISRICKSLEPYERKLGPDTWYYAKRCFLALAENMSKQMLVLKDTTMQDILNFLDAADAHGANITTVIETEVDPDGNHPIDHSTRNVSWEARQMKKLFLSLES